MDGRNKFIKLQKIRNGGNIKRYHTIPTIREQTNAAHSWGVAVLFDQLWGQTWGENALASTKCLKSSLYHDCAEHLTGDLPAPIKKSSKAVAKVIKELEDNFNKELDILVRLEDKDEVKVKFCDCLEGALFCLEELEMGNKKVIDVFGRYMEYLREQVNEHKQLKEVEWIIEQLTKEATKL
jgi:5'-deoxynucleotidase YfbR-like HD superfamily hydrolase